MGGRKTEIYISSGLYEALGNTWVTFSFLWLRGERQREQISFPEVWEQIR